MAIRSVHLRFKAANLICSEVCESEHVESNLLLKMYEHLLKEEAAAAYFKAVKKTDDNTAPIIRKLN
jgi:hypothetical protein